jgi:PAS domain-containing serine/threonine kinase
MHILSYNRWRAGLKQWASKENHTGLSGDSHISSLFGSLQLHFEQPFYRKEPRLQYGTDAAVFSSQFPEGHQLNADFVKAYQLQDELGCGGYGFVMTALDRAERHEVAVKFIIKAKLPSHAWMEDDEYGRLPTEVVLLSCIKHENIVRCLGLFEDDLYFYMVGV